MIIFLIPKVCDLYYYLYRRYNKLKCFVHRITVVHVAGVPSLDQTHCKICNCLFFTALTKNNHTKTSLKR